MSKQDMIRKLTSRKFLITVAAFLGSIGASIAGLHTENEIVAAVGIICGIISAAIYTASEAYVDAARAEAAITFQAIDDFDELTEEELSAEDFAREAAKAGLTADEAADAFNAAIKGAMMKNES